MSVLVGTTPKIKVACTALTEEDGQKIKVPFTAVFTRLNRKANKELQKRIQELMRELRAVAKDILVIEGSSPAKDDGGSFVTAALNDDQEPKDSKLTLLSSDEIEQARELKAQQADAIGEKLTQEIIDHLHSIEKLKDQTGKVVAYSEELRDEMLEWEPYFIALREGLNKATGTYQEERVKN